MRFHLFIPLAVFSFSAWLPVQSHAQIVTNRVNPLADAYVRSDQPNNNFGTFTNLYVRTNAVNGTATCHGCFKFSLTTLCDVQGASLRVFAPMQYTGSVVLLAYSVTDTSWTEDGITWNNRPVAGNLLSAVTVNVTDTLGHWYEFDVTAFIKGEVAAGHALATLLLVETQILSGNTANYAKVVSREFSVNKPELAWVQQPLPAVKVFATANTLNEGGPGVDFVFQRSCTLLNEPLSVNFAVLEAGQMAGLVNAFGLATRSITIPANETSFSTTVYAVEDQFKTGDSNGDKLLSVVLKQSPATYIIDAAQPSAQIMVHDNDTTPAPLADQWPGVFNPWTVQRVDLVMPPATWTALLNETSHCNPTRHDVSVSNGAQVVEAKVWAKSDSRRGNKITLRVDFNEVNDDARWRGLQRLNLQAEAPLEEGLAHYFHQTAAGLYGYDPALATFVELYVNGVYNGVYLHREKVDRQFVENRGFRRKNSTWIYESHPDCMGNPRVYPNEAVDSPVFQAISNVALQPGGTSDKYFDFEAVVTQGAVDQLIGNSDGMLQGNNFLRADFHYSTTLFPDGPPRTIKRSFTIARDLGSPRFTGSPCMNVDLFTISEPRGSQRHREILKELTEDVLSPTAMTEIINRLQFMLMESLQADPSVTTTTDNECATGQPLIEYFDDKRTFPAARMLWLDANILQPVLGPLPAKPQMLLGPDNLLTISTTTADAEIWYTTKEAVDPWLLNTPANADPDPATPHFTSSSGSLTLPGTRHVVARARKNGMWSPVAKQTFVLPLPPGALQFTEINSRPAAPSAAEVAAGFDRRDDFEYFTVRNTSASPIDLSDHYLEGVVYRFPPGPKWILPGGDFRVVRNPKAFEMRHGTTPYHAVYWDGKLADRGERLAIHAPDGTTVAAVDFPGLSVLKITEIHYNPAGTPFESDNTEFVEIKNTGTETLDVSQCRLHRGIELEFAAGTTIPPGGFLTVTRNPTEFQLRYPGIVPYSVGYSGRLSNNGEDIELEVFDEADLDWDRITLVDYKVQLPWPMWASGFGHSLVNINPAGDPNDPSNWRASAAVHGSPNADDPAPPPVPNYSLQVPVGGASDPNFFPVAALGIDEVGLATGYGAHNGLEYGFLFDSIEGGGQAARAWTSNPNCPELNVPGNPFPWTSRGNAISDGLMVGFIEYDGPGIPTAAIWQNGPTPINGCLGGSGILDYGQVTAYIANGFAGHLVGFAIDPGTPENEAIAKRGDINGWHEVLPGYSSTNLTVANGVNFGGEAVGASINPTDNQLHPLYWALDGTAFEMQVLPSAVGGEALGINNSGWIVGYNLMADGTKRACIWRAWSVAPTELGIWGQSGYSVATAVNNQGRIVGYSNNRACEWITGVIVDLNLLTPPSAHTLVRAYGLNDGRQIVGCTSWGTETAPPPHYPTNHTAKAFVLTPQ